MLTVLWIIKGNNLPAHSGKVSGDRSTAIVLRQKQCAECTGKLFSIKGDGTIRIDLQKHSGMFRNSQDGE